MTIPIKMIRAYPTKHFRVHFSFDPIRCYLYNGGIGFCKIMCWGEGGQMHLSKIWSKLHWWEYVAQDVIWKKTFYFQCIIGRIVNIFWRKCSLKLITFWQIYLIIARKAQWLFQQYSCVTKMILPSKGNHPILCMPYAWQWQWQWQWMTMKGYLLSKLYRVNPNIIRVHGISQRTT